MKNLFTKHYKLLKSNSFEFVDIPLDEDLEAFICPFLIENNKKEKIIKEVYSRVHQFLIKLNRDYIIPNNRKGGLKYLSHLHEPNEYHLGYSGKNKGKAVSTPRAEIIFNALRNNRFARKGLSITNEAHFVLLLVKGVGQDIISDIIANVCRDIFADFTTNVCNKHGVITFKQKIEYYDSSNEQWQIRSAELPIYLGKKVILLPKILVSGKREYSNLYNWFVASHYIAPEILSGIKEVSNPDDFIRKLKDGTRAAIIKRIYSIYRKPKQDLIDFVINYKGSLDEFVRHAKENYPQLYIDDLIP